MEQIKSLEIGDILKNGEKYCKVLAVVGDTFLRSGFNEDKSALDEESAESWYTFNEIVRLGWHKVDENDEAAEAIALLERLGRIVNGRIIT